ncbi:MAG: zinc-binding dehydrogenase [Pseudolabrys sp.]
MSPACNWAKALGAATVVAGVLGADNVEVARRCGADAIIDLGAIDLRDGLRDAVRAATGGHGADVVIDPVGGAANAAALRAMAWRGRMVIIGFAAGEIPTIKTNYLLVKNIEVSRPAMVGLPRPHARLGAARPGRDFRAACRRQGRSGHQPQVSP